MYAQNPSYFFLTALNVVCQDSPRYNIMYVQDQTGTRSLMSLVRPADRIRAQALRARAARCPWPAGAARVVDPATASRPPVPDLGSRGVPPGLPARAPDPETGPPGSA